MIVKALGVNSEPKCDASFLQGLPDLLEHGAGAEVQHRRLHGSEQLSGGQPDQPAPPPPPQHPHRPHV